MASEKCQIKYINNHLIPSIVKKLGEQTLINCKIENCTGLDGFMSILYKVNFKVADCKTNKEDSHFLIVKFMKGDLQFRKASKSYTQFANEIFIYSKVLPYYEKLVSKSGSTINVKQWVPHVYFANYGNIEGLGDGLSPESVLALENLSEKGYRSGPRLCLDRKHLLLMIKPLAEYHSMTYVMRIQKDEQLQKFINEIIPLPWADKNGLYDTLYKAAFERFFLYFDKTKQSYDEDFVKNVEKLRQYREDPTKLLEKYREVDETFSLILHGDYNRNNVLFKYTDSESFDHPKDLKMIDFQELRYGTPAIDLSFLMYMNTDPSIREDVWMELLKYYHQTMLNSLAEVLEVQPEGETLKAYGFEKFNEHFTKFGFYGAIVCMHFLPWMLSSVDECSELNRLFTCDMHGEPFRKLSIEAGGEGADKIIMDIVNHASRMGYMSFI